MSVESRPMMTVGEVAKLLNVSKDYVRDTLIALGTLKALRYTENGHYRIDPASLDQLMDRKYVETETSERTRKAIDEDAKDAMRSLGVEC